MILESLQYVSNQLDLHLKHQFGLDEPSVVINRIVDSEGNIPLGNQNKVVVSLIHLEEESAVPIYGMRRNEENYSKQPSEISESVYVLVVPNFEAYEEGLKFLNSSINFFRQNSAFDAKILADFPKEISKLTIELVKGEGYAQMHNLWSALGARYQPSIVYRLRVIGFDQEVIKEISTSEIKPSN